MSLSDTSIEERSIINSLAATKSFSAVVVFPPGSLVYKVVFNCDPICDRTAACREIRPQITRCESRAQELIDRLTKSTSTLKSAPVIQTPPITIRESSHGRGL